MHLGVLPARLMGPLSEYLQETQKINIHDLGPAGAWRRVVDMAIEREVHAVALAGDLVDRNNALFEAFGLLEDGLRRLEAANIPVVAVAGNHDTEVLPRLEPLLNNLVLLGPGGTWSSHLIKGDHPLAVRLTGWSFPSRHYQSSPLKNGAPDPDTHHPTLGLLHADLDQTTSNYAPVPTSQLLDAGYKAWFLGHTHTPGEISTDGSPFYLGSLCGLHPGETGEHGPVLVELNAQGEMSMQRLPLATLRWENLILDLSDLANPSDDLLPHLLHQLTEKAKSLSTALDRTLALGFRLRLTGSLENPSQLRESLSRIEDDLSLLISENLGTLLFVDKISNHTTQKIDLVELAQQEYPEGLLARQILVLENHSAPIPGVTRTDDYKEKLISKARQELDQIDRKSAYLGLGKPLETEEICTLLADSARKALEEVLKRKEVGHAAE